MSKFTVLFICLCVILLGICVYARHDTLKANSYWGNKNTTIHQLLLELSDDFFRETEKYGITSVLAGGGLLGSLRTGAMIPWDDDLDIFVLHETEKDKQDISNIIIDIYKDSKYMYLKNTDFGFRLYYKNKKPFVDIFFVQKQQDIYHFTLKRLRKKFPRHWLYADEINNVSSCKIEDKYFPCPSNTLNVLKRWYGDDCMDNPKITHVHISNPFDWVIVKIGNFFKLSNIDMERFAFKDLI